jgi:hypothetical protein
MDAYGYSEKVIQILQSRPGQSLANTYQLRVRQHHTIHPARTLLHIVRIFPARYDIMQHTLLFDRQASVWFVLKQHDAVAT